MLKSKQRAFLRGIASSYETIFQVGKGGINENFINQVTDALRKRELIKLRVLENSGSSPKGSSVSSSALLSKLTEGTFSVSLLSEIAKAPPPTAKAIETDAVIILYFLFIAYLLNQP